MKKALHWLPVALCVGFLLLIGYVQRERAWKGQNDFVQLYTGATLAGTPELYSRTANLRVVDATLGFTLESVVYTRPPFYAALLKPLAYLPYLAAYGVFSLASLVSILWFVIRFYKECPALPFFAAMSIPALAALCGGQDTPFLLPILGASILLTRGNRDFWAGAVLSLLAIKFHLFLLVPLLLVMKRRWALLAGGAAGTAGLTFLGVAVCGVRALPEYMNVLLDPWINFTATAMPNLHGLAAVLPRGRVVEWTLVCVVMLLFVWMVTRTASYDILLAASLVCGQLLSFHSGVADTIVLLPAFVLVFSASSNVPLRVMSALILTPVPYFLLFSGPPYSAFLSIAMLALAGLLFASANQQPAGAPASGTGLTLPQTA